jgi:hypothetical protein
VLSRPFSLPNGPTSFNIIIALLAMALAIVSTTGAEPRRVLPLEVGKAAISVIYRVLS